MYSVFLALHSVLRWLVLASLLYAVYRSYKGWFGDKPFTKFDNSVRHVTATISHLQLVIGICLYFVSPIINYFIHHFKAALPQREIRFFGMEHNLVMLLAIVLISLGSMKAKRKNGDRQKFKTLAIWYSSALILILISVPWPFSPMAARPYWRAF